MKAEKTYTVIRNCDCNRHNAQNNNKTNRNPQEIDKEFSTIKTLIFRQKRLIHGVIHIIHRKTGSNNQDFMVTEGTSVLYKNHKIDTGTKKMHKNP